MIDADFDAFVASWTSISPPTPFRTGIDSSKNADCVSRSASTAFIAPTLTQMFTPKFSFLQTVDDPLSGDQGTFRTNTLTGNPDLISEEADVYNLGFSLNLLDGDLTLGVDYSRFEP